MSHDANDLMLLGEAVGLAPKSAAYWLKENIMIEMEERRALHQDDRKLKFVRKFMKMAKAVADDNQACYSRKIGCVITDTSFRVTGVGYNGPPTGTPHCDSAEYLENFFCPQLTNQEKKHLKIGELTTKQWVDREKDCLVCPRWLVDAGPGERSTLCSCQHSERNAITNSTVDLNNGMIFCWCGVPCIDCAGAIINSGIKEVHCLKVDGPDYHPVSRWLLQKADVTLYLYNKDYIDPSMQARAA